MQNISLRRLKNRYDEIKERDEAIKTDYFKVIMKGLEGEVTYGILERHRERQDTEQSGIFDPWQQQRGASCACYSLMSIAFSAAWLDITREKRRNRRGKTKGIKTRRMHSHMT